MDKREHDHASYIADGALRIGYVAGRLGTWALKALFYPSILSLRDKLNSSQEEYETAHGSIVTWQLIKTAAISCVYLASPQETTTNLAGSSLLAINGIDTMLCILHTIGYAHRGANQK